MTTTPQEPEGDPTEPFETPDLPEPGTDPNPGTNPEVSPLTED